MEVRFTPGQEARLAEYASRTGRDQEQVVRDAVEQVLNDVRFEEAAQKGFTSLDRGEFVAHEDVGVRLDQLLRT